MTVGGGNERFDSNSQILVLAAGGVEVGCELRLRQIVRSVDEDLEVSHRLCFSAISSKPGACQMRKRVPVSPMCVPARAR